MELHFNISVDRALAIFTQLNIPFDPKGNKINLICPFHDDKDFGNAYIRTDRNYFFKCHRCGRASNIYGYLKQRTSLSPKEIFKLLDIEDSFGLESYVAESDSQVHVTNNESIRDGEISYLPLDYVLKNSLKFNPEDYYYTKLKEYDKEFMEKFNTRKMVTGYFKDYFVVDISSKKLDIHAFEFRKINEFERLTKFFKKEFPDLKTIRKEFKELAEYGDIKLEDYFKKEISVKGTISVDPEIAYLLQRKILYSRNTRTDLLLFNYDNLDFEQPLFVTESTSTVPLLRQHVGWNTTSTFGTSVSQTQLELLSQFKIIIYIPDGDQASVDWITQSYDYLPQVKVLPLQLNDSMEGYKAHLFELTKNWKDNLMSPVLYSSRFEKRLEKVVFER